MLWPYLLELLIPEAYTEAAGTLCLAIHNITARKRLNNDDDYLINFSEQGVHHVVVAVMMISNHY